jgi:hypothetical protein
MVREWLRAQAISDAHFGAPVLYTWLTAADEAALRAGGSITATTVHESRSGLDDWIANAPAPGVSEHLAEPAHAGRQRAWPSAWAARRGFAFVPEVGERLARIELRPESLIVLYDTRTQPPTIAFSTERGVPAPTGEALQVSELWAAVFLIGWDRHDDGGRSVWREYVLISPAMIGRVSIGSPEIAAELRVERERLTALGHDVGASETPIATDALEAAWAALPDRDATPERLFAAAIPDDRNVLGQRPLLELVGMLVDRGDAFEWRTELASEPRPQLRE